MSVFSKIKNVLFTEEEVTEEIPMITKEEVRSVSKPVIEEEETQEIPRFKNIKYDRVEEENKEEFKEIPNIREEIREEKVEVRKEEKSPFQTFDEEEFDRIAAVNKHRLIERDRKAREEKERINRLQSSPIKNEMRAPEEEKRFKPTPVISPVYGILDKNYTKDDILPRASSEGTLPKIMDVDEVRQKAFGTLEDLERNIKEETLENVKITTFVDQDEKKDDTVVLDSNGDIHTIENEVEQMEEEKSPTKEIPKIEAIDETDIEESEVELPDLNIDDFTNEAEQTKEEKVKEDEQIENDLFDLIDSMYQEDGDK